MSRYWLSALLFGLALGCSSTSTNSSDCTTGETKQCACPGAQVGIQTCQSDGTYSTCEQCQAPASGGSGGSSAQGGSGSGGAAGSTAGGAGGSGGSGEGNANQCPGKEVLLSGSPLSGTVTGNFANHGDVVQPTCQFSDGMRSAVYRVRPTAPGAMAVELNTSTNVRLVVSIREGNCEDTTYEIDCIGDHNANVSVKANTDYYIVIAGDPNPYTLDVTLP